MTPHYIRQLQARDEADRARQAAAVELNRKAEAHAARDRLRPLDDRLVRLLATIPASVQRDGLSLLALAGLLRGRRGGAAQTGALGLALRRAGWTRKRGWSEGEDGFLSRWFPPGAA